MLGGQALWPPATLCLLICRTEPSQDLALVSKAIILTNWVKMSRAQKAGKGSVGCLGGDDEPKEVSFSLLRAHYLQDDCGIPEMPLSTSGLLVLAAPDGCPQGSLQLSINIKPTISKGVPTMPRCVVPEQFCLE